MDELKKQLKEIASSDKTYEKITEIGDKYDLMIDAQGELAAETRNVISGFKSVKDFVKNIKEKLEIDDDLAKKIASDVSLQIFEEIRDKLQKIQDENIDNNQSETPLPTPTPPQNPNLSPLEKAGGFEIVNNKPISSSPQYKDSNLNKDQVLKDIENPPSKVSFVDHLLANPATPPKPPTPEPPKKTPAMDPYREPIE